MEEYGVTNMSNMEIEANVSLFSIVEDHSPPSSPLLPEQNQQEVVEENDGEEENVVLRVDFNWRLRITTRQTAGCMPGLEESCSHQTVDTPFRADIFNPPLPLKRAEKQNANVKQSLLNPDEMENKVKKTGQDRGTDSNSSPSSRESEGTVTSASMTDSESSETAGKLVPETVDRAAANVDDLLQCISRWEAEECSGSGAEDTLQKVERKLRKFFGLRRVFAENQGETLEVTVDPVEAPSQEDDICPTTSNVRRQKSSDRTGEKSSGRHGRKMYKKIKSAWKWCFRSKSSGEVQEEKDLSETASSDGSDSKQNSPCPEEASFTAPVSYSGDIRDTTKADLVKDKGASPEPSLLLPPTEYVDDVVQSTSNVPSLLKPGSPKEMSTEMDAPSQESGKDDCGNITVVTPVQSCHSDRAVKKSLSRHGNKKKRNIKSAWKRIFKWRPEKKVSKKQDSVETDGSDLKPGSPNNDLTSGCTFPKRISPTASFECNEDMNAGEKSDRSSAPLELEDLEDDDITTEDVGSKSVTTNASPPPEYTEERSSVTEKDLIIPKDSTPGPSEQDRLLESFQEDNGSTVLVELTGLKKTFYEIITRYFDSLTEQQRKDIKNHSLTVDVKKKLADLYLEVLIVVIETIMDILVEMTTRGATSLPVWWTEVDPQRMSLKLLREKLDITEVNIEQSLKASFGRALFDVVAESSLPIPPKITEAITTAITDEVNSVLSETIQASLNRGSSTDVAAMCCQFPSCRAFVDTLSGVISEMKSLLNGMRTQRNLNKNRVVGLAVGRPTEVQKKKRWRLFNKWRVNRVCPSPEEEDIKSLAEDVPIKRCSLLKRIILSCCTLCMSIDVLE